MHISISPSRSSSALLRRILVALSLAGTVGFAGCSGCVGPPPGDGDGDGDGDDDGGTLAPPAITAFTSSHASITAGTGSDGNPVQGTATLSFTLEGAGGIELLVDGQAQPIGTCIPASGATSCAEGGAIAVTPTETTTYLLVVSNDGEPCAVDGADVLDATRCASASVSVDVVAPARASLTPSTTLVESGGSVVVTYLVVDAADFSIGVVEIVDGERVIDPCEPATTASPDAPCTLPVIGADVATSGNISFADVTAGFTLAVVATTDAEDDLGDIAVGDVEVSVAVMGAPLVATATIEDDTRRPGQDAVLSWTTENATSMQVSASPSSSVTGLGACTTVDGTGAGGCTISVVAGAPLGAITLTFVAVHDGESSPAVTRTLTIGEPPVVAFSATPESLPAEGGAVALTWTAPSAVRVTIVDDAEPPVTHVDTENDTGDASCTGGACDAVGDTFTTDTLLFSSNFTLTASNDFGDRAVIAAVFVTGSPQIDTLTVDGDDATDALAIVDAASAELAWATTDAVSTELERAPYPLEGCAAAAFVVEPTFGGAADGTFALTGLTGEHCVRFGAVGSAGQKTRRTFKVVRAPEVSSFAALDDTLVHNDSIALSWQTTRALSVSVTAQPAGAVTTSELAACSVVDGSGAGSCALTIQPGTPLGDVTFTLVANGPDGALSPEAEATVTVGTAPSIGAFTATPTTITGATTVTLAWTSSNAASVTITSPGDVTEFTSSTPGVVANGTHDVVDLAATTTFTLEAESSYGVATAQVTVFNGPSFDTVLVDGDDGADGVASALTGSPNLTWGTTDATSVEVFAGDVPGSGDCVDADFTSIATGGATGSVELTELARDRCLRLVAENDAAQVSELLVLVEDRPFVTALSAAPGAITRANGGTIVVSLSSTGAPNLSVVADYMNGLGEVLSSQSVCTEATLNSGNPNGDTASDASSCSDTYDGTGCILFCRIIPAGTTSIRYRLTITDEEGDSATLDTSAGGDVTVN